MTTKCVMQHFQGYRAAPMLYHGSIRFERTSSGLHTFRTIRINPFEHKIAVLRNLG